MSWKKEQLNRWLGRDQEEMQVRFRYTVSPEIARIQEWCGRRIQVPRAILSIPQDSSGDELLCNMEDPIPSSPSTTSSDSSSSIPNNPNKRRRLDLNHIEQLEEEEPAGPSKLRRSRRNIKKPTKYYCS
ncbi:unnamed protein product [Allacma fusca]|uniref:Uncharacterized protein n=1 Tax=Allacma fusca TaxID=39272 RepID=A0A8J2PUU4_9HEXA|nr:unnamed protein product [Allacma fusca]